MSMTPKALIYNFISVLVKCNFWHPGFLTLMTERESARMSKITNDGLTRSGTECFINCNVCVLTTGCSELPHETVQSARDEHADRPHASVPRLSGDSRRRLPWQHSMFQHAGGTGAVVGTGCVHKPQPDARSSILCGRRRRQRLCLRRRWTDGDGWRRKPRHQQRV